MKRFLKDYRLHEHTEALFLLTLGIMIQVLDGSPLDMRSRWCLAWETEFPREYFPSYTQSIIKTVLALIILTRCLTSVLYVIFGVIVLGCIIKETSPKLMLPWLFISGVKSVLLTLLEALTGVYVCSTFGKIRKPCIEFIISKAVELFFATYLWACIRSIHKDFEMYEESVREEKLLMQMVIQRVNLRKRRARSMVDETTLYKTANLNYFELKDVPNIIFDMLKSEEELSQDSLLGPGMMLASVSNMGSYDYLKTSSSLGELGYIDLGSFQVIGLDDEKNLSPSMRAMKFLKLTWDDVHKARERIRNEGFPSNYDAPESIPEEISTVKPSAILAKHQRHDEVYFADIPDMERLREEEELRIRMKMKRRKGFLEDVERSESRERLIGTEDEVDADADASKLDDGPGMSRMDGEEVPDLWLMTNQKEESVTRVAESQKKPSDNYAKLYNQEYMSVIGPEVFDKASKLLKLTSLRDEDEGAAGVMRAESREHQTVSLRRKKIIFDECYTTHTALPLSIIVTNFPVRLDSAMRCETFYFGRPSSTSAELSLRQDGAVHASGFDAPDGSEGEEEARPSTTTTTTTVVSRRGSEVKFPALDCSRVSLLLLRCGVDKPQVKSIAMMGTMGVDPKLSVLERKPDLPVLKSAEVNDILNANLGRCRSPHPTTPDQISFIRELMTMPIGEVLKSYYDLRERSCESRIVRRRPSRDSPEKPWKFRPLEKIVRSLSPEPSDAEEMEVAAGKIRLGSPKTEKLKTKGNNALQPMYLFGSQESGWSSSPLGLSADGKKLKATCVKPVKVPAAAAAKPAKPKAKKVVNRRNSNFAKLAEKVTKAMAAEEKRSADKAPSSGRGETAKRPPPPPPPVRLRCDVSNPGLDASREMLSVTANDDNPSLCSAESEESFSLFYSKTADLTSPLLDTRRFIYPDHIHYSYKNVRKKGFDVELGGGLPLLVRDSLTLSPSRTVKRMDAEPPDPQTRITRRPMDLAFASNGKKRREKSRPKRDASAGKKSRSPARWDVDAKNSGEIAAPDAKKKQQRWMRKFSREDRAALDGDNAGGNKAKKKKKEAAAQKAR